MGQEQLKVTFHDAKAPEAQRNLRTGLHVTGWEVGDSGLAKCLQEPVAQEL